MTKILCVIGKTGVGKTTRISDLVKNDYGVLPIYIGRECREKFGEYNITRMSNASAPDELDSFIYGLIDDHIKRVRDGSGNRETKTVVLDGFPRKASQVDWLVRKVEKGCHVEIELLTCPEDERRKRLDTRDGEDPDKVELTKERIKVESANLFETLVRVSSCNTIDKYIPINIVNVGGTSEQTSYQIRDRMGLLFALNNRLSDMTIYRYNQSMNNLMNSLHGKVEVDQIHPTLVWVRRFVEKAIDELKEALDKMPDNWWSVDKVELDPIRVELIDALHFQLSAFFSLGVDETGLMHLYRSKNKVNIDRQLSKSYSKVNKSESNSDDNHIIL